MCECGCTMNDRKYRFPGPTKSFYVLTLHGACENCDAPTGISIELILPGTFLFKRENREEFTDGELQFHDWPESKGVAIQCGMLKHEFVAKLMPHLIGLDSSEMGGDDGKIDSYGAEVILEEMYEDAQVRPSIVNARGMSNQAG